MRVVLITFFLLLAATGVRAETPPPAATSAEQVDALIAASGLQQQINQIPLAIGSAGQQQAGMALAFVQPLISALQDAFKPDELIQTLRVDLMRQLDAATLADALRWYNSDAGKSILAAEQRMMQPDVMEKIGQAISQQQLTGLTPERKKQLQQLDVATGATDTALDLMLTMQAAFLSGFSQLITPDQQAPFDSLRESFNSNREEYRATISEQLLLQQAVLLEPVTDASLQEFSTFAASASGQKLFAAMRISLDNTLRTAALKIPTAVSQVSDALRMEVKVLPGDAAQGTEPKPEITPVAP